MLLRAFPLSEVWRIWGWKFSDLYGVALLSGRELRVVVNTNDPDYEHVYSIEAYDDPLDELLYLPPPANQSDGTVFHIVSNSVMQWNSTLEYHLNQPSHTQKFLCVACLQAK